MREGGGAQLRGVKGVAHLAPPEAAGMPTKKPWRNFLLLFLSWTDSISAIEGEILVRGRSSSKTSPPVPALLVGSGGAINTFMSAFYHPYIYNKLLTTKLLN